MQMNLSEETVQTIIDSLNCSKQILKKQFKIEIGLKQEIIKFQLEEVLDALSIMEEIQDYYKGGYIA